MPSSLEEAIVEYLINEETVTRQQLVSHFKARPATIFKAVLKLNKSGILHEPDRKGTKTVKCALPSEQYLYSFKV